MAVLLSSVYLDEQAQLKAPQSKIVVPVPLDKGGHEGKCHVRRMSRRTLLPRAARLDDPAGSVFPIVRLCRASIVSQEQLSELGHFLAQPLHVLENRVGLLLRLADPLDNPGSKGGGHSPQNGDATHHQTDRDATTQGRHRDRRVPDLVAPPARHPHTGQTSYTPRQAAYDLHKPRGKNLISKPGRGHRYQVPPQAARSIAALLALHDHVIAPIIAGVRSPRPGRKPIAWTQIDRDHEQLRIHMQTLFNDLGITTTATAA